MNSCLRMRQSVFDQWTTCLPCRIMRIGFFWEFSLLFFSMDPFFPVKVLIFNSVDRSNFNFRCVVSGVHRLAYEQLVFCDIFHQKESGWRDCSFCGKVRRWHCANSVQIIALSCIATVFWWNLQFQRLHCGCVASKNSYDLLDSGGVQCVACMKNSAAQSVSILSSCDPYIPFPNNLIVLFTGFWSSGSKAFSMSK